MKGLSLVACLVVFVSTALQAAPSKRAAESAPDFWYVVPNDSSPTTASRSVRGIVVPSTVNPTVQSTPGGSVISWRRPDGTRQSFVVQGLSAYTFVPGPLKGTTYVSFRVGRKFENWPDERCCSCASWENSVESTEALSCIPGCIGCGCEGCICSPTVPCPTGPLDTMTLVANNGSAPMMAFGKSAGGGGITVASHGGAAARFLGRRLSAELTTRGETVINDPDSITLSGRIETHAAVRDEKAFFAWVSPEAAVILEQPRSMPAPSLRGGTIEFAPRPTDEQSTRAKYLAIDPVLDRCRACGTHPNSDSDLDIYDCVPGFSVCYRCVSWEC